MNRRPMAGAATASALALAFLFAALPARAEHSENYETYCTICHGEDGKAQTEKGKEKRARDFTNAKWQGKVDDARLAKSIAKGHGKMPKFGDKLSADDIAALVKEVRAFVGK